MRAFYENSLVVLAGGLILFAPLFRSGKTFFALMTMELIGIAMLLIILWSNLLSGRMQKHVKWFLFAGFGVALAYLVPLPTSLWEILPGRSWYVEHVTWANATSTEYTYRALSLIPYRTISGLLALIAPLALFLTALSLPERKLYWIIYVLLLAATGQAVLSMLQYFIQDQDLFFRVWSGNIPLGTYINQNHFVAFMEMAEPLALGLMIVVLTQHNTGIITKTVLTILFGLISLALTFTPLLSASRTGTALLLLSIFLSFWVMTTPELRKKVAAPIIGLRFVLLVLAVAIQLNVIQRIATESYTTGFEPKVVAGDLRWTIYTSTWEGVKYYFPFGSGPGTMPQAYQMFQPTNLSAFMNHAHNDYLELIFDMGLFGILIILGIVVIYIYRWKEIWQGINIPFKLMQSGAGVGILLALLYSITDFGLHTPANAIFFALLFGIFLHQPHPKQLLK